MKTSPLTTNHSNKDHTMRTLLTTNHTNNNQTMKTPHRIQTLLSCSIALAATCAIATAIAAAETPPATDKPDKKDAAIQAAPTEVTIVPNLTETQWKLKSWTDKNLDPTKFGITAAFQDLKGKPYVRGYSGLNSYGASYLAKADGSFSLGTISGTKIAGLDANMKAEMLYRDLLKQVRKHAMDGEKLVLFDEKGKELLVFEKAQPAAE